MILVLRLPFSIGGGTDHKRGSFLHDKMNLERSSRPLCRGQDWKGLKWLRMAAEKRPVEEDTSGPKDSNWDGVRGEKGGIIASERGGGEPTGLYGGQR